jgi:hypothetical protein
MSDGVIPLPIADCALPIELQGKRFGKNLPAKQRVIGNAQLAIPCPQT